MAHEQQQENQIQSQSLQELLAAHLNSRQESIYGKQIQNVQESKKNSKTSSPKTAENFSASSTERPQLKTDLLDEIRTYSKNNLKKTKINIHKDNPTSSFTVNSKIEGMLEAAQSRHQETHSFSDDTNWDDNSIEPSSPKGNLIEPKVKPTQQSIIQESNTSLSDISASNLAPTARTMQPEINQQGKPSSFAKARQKIETFFINLFNGKTTQNSSKTPVTTHSMGSANASNHEPNTEQVQNRVNDSQPKKVKALIEQFNNTPSHPYARLPENKKVFNKNNPQVQAPTESTSHTAVEENYQRKPVKELINQFNSIKDHTYAGYVHIAGATANNRTPIINEDVAHNTPSVSVPSSIHATAPSQPPVVDNSVELESIPPLEEVSLVNQNRSIILQQIAEDEALAKQLQAKEIAASLSDSYDKEAQIKADEIYARQVHDELNNQALVATPAKKVEPTQPQPIIEEPDDEVTNNRALDRKPEIDSNRQMNEYPSSQSRQRITVIEFQSIVMIPVFTSILEATKLSLDVTKLCVDTMVSVMAVWIPVVVARQQIIIISEDNNRISAGSCRQQYQQSASTPIITEVDDNDTNASSTLRRGPGITAC